MPQGEKIPLGRSALLCIRKKLPEEIRQVCRRSRNNCRKYKKGDVLCRRPVMQL